MLIISMTHMGIKFINIWQNVFTLEKVQVSLLLKNPATFKSLQQLMFSNLCLLISSTYLCNIVMLFDLGLTSSSNWITCRVSVKFSSTCVSFQGQRCSPGTSQNWVYPSVALFGGRTNYLHNSSPLCFNQTILILLAQFSE